MTKEYKLQSRLQDEGWEDVERATVFYDLAQACHIARKLDGFFYGMVRVVEINTGKIMVEFPAVSAAEKEILGDLKLRDVHTGHCCLEHGCKYGDPNCTVMQRIASSEGPCEECGLELEGYYGHEEQQTAARRWPDDLRAQDVRDQQTGDITQVLSQVAEECQRARAKHPPLNSTHEAHSVILEEFEEWWDSVKADEPDDKELLSVAAMAVLAIVELQGKNRREGESKSCHPQTDNLCKWCKQGIGRSYVMHDNGNYYLSPSCSGDFNSTKQLCSRCFGPMENKNESI